ncbi:MULTISPECIES: hypothetical protein [unclassified Variovorax]|jgi:hypothetical protein|uniref:hypothetical protein n=1 Tax=unclassified Variovorax TaxID=663243 RepID=UPI000F7DCB9D|nr:MULTISPECIES: hypothetical protein [unclassified Variovorax]RSZ47261.1 hypothetical protein EJO70_01175 [Variovorax sp. 553]RSZ48616.1 hypothetical protein EJO71_02795 [Variovorax sp. 679]
MAASARASAHVSSFPESSEAASIESLALQACDDIDSLREMQRAYSCLEKLVLPQGVNDTEEVYPNRVELGALIRVINEDLQRRIEAMDSTLQSLRATLSNQD